MGRVLANPNAHRSESRLNPFVTTKRYGLEHYRIERENEGASTGSVIASGWGRSTSEDQRSVDPSYTVSFVQR